MVRNLPAMWETQVRSLRRTPREGHGTPLQCSCLENPTDRGAWCPAVSQSQTLSWKQGLRGLSPLDRDTHTQTHFSQVERPCHGLLARHGSVSSSHGNCSLVTSASNLSNASHPYSGFSLMEGVLRYYLNTKHTESRCVLGCTKAGFRIRGVNRSSPCKSSVPTPPQPCHPPCNVWALDPSDPEVQRSPWRPGFGQRCLGSAFWAPSGPLTCQPLPRPTAPPSNAPPCSVFPLQVFLPALILQAPSIISSGDLALTKPGMNLFSWSESPKPGSVKFGYQLDMSTGEGRRRNPRYQVRGHILTVEPATMSCTSAGCPPAAPSSLWGSV